MSELATYALERLWEDGEFVLSRGVRQGDSTAVFVLSPALEQPVPETFRRLEYVYALRHELDSDWAARPLALVRHDGRPALEMEDRGGNLLEERLGQPMEVQHFLRLAISVAAALGRLHSQGLIHRSLRPANVYLDLVSGKARLISIYTTPRLSSGRSVPASPEPTDATLPYMAPEQTGRMNRSTDSRSDLYAYGILLYKMVTGVLPFAAKDSMEWIHCHVAIQPIPPNQRVQGVPEQISAIIMKLLAKIPEERYQTAAGVERDLRQCLEALESGGQIAPFPVGVRDVPDQLLISEKLYGRDSEIDTLLAAFRRVASDGTPELVLVSGYSGIGKSTVVNQLHEHLVPLRGLFASGKFDQHKGDIPYTTVTHAFQALVRQILSKSDGEVSQWRDRIVEALGTNGQLISNLLPELELIIGKQPPARYLPPREAQNRFRITFRRFLCVFARPERPLALFLDDMQWADAGTLELLENLLTEPEVRHLLLIYAYRSNEVGASDPLRRTLEKLPDTGVAVREITLPPLSLRDVTQLVTDSLYSESDRVEPLAELMHKKTGGNPFFAIQFFKALAEEKLLVFDPATAGWNWNLEHIRTKGFTDNIADMMTEKLDSLSVATQQTLKQLACLGSSTPMSTMSMVSGKSEEALDAVLLEAIRAGLVSRHNGSLKFAHDRVQEAAYQLIPEADRAFEHLRIGRLLLEHIPSDQIEDAIFEIVNQLNRGVAQVTTAEKRTRLVELNLIAGKRAKTGAAYVSALNYLAISSELLGKDCWDSNYETTFAITLNLAECELLTGQLRAADERLSRLSTLAANHGDRAAVTSLREMLYTTSDREERAVDVCLEYLRSAGFACPRDPTQEEVAQEYERIWLRLGRRTIEELVDLPLMTDPACRGALEVITAIIPPSWFTDENLRNLLVARMVNLSLEYGNSEASCYAYALLARTLGSHFGDYQTGYRFGTLSLELVDKRGLDRFKTRVYSCFGHHIDPWKHHLKNGRKCLRLAFAAAPQAGDLTFAAYNCANTVSNLLASGEPLSDVQNEAESGLEFARRMGNGLAVDLITSQLTYIRALRGLTANLASFNYTEFDEHDFERHLDCDPHLAAAKFRYWVRKLETHFYAGDYASSAEAAAKAQEFGWRSQSFFEVAEYPFYTALALAGLYSAASADERIRHLDTIAAYQELLSRWVRNCPENFACMEALVAAEIARIEGRNLDAELLYEDSLSSAHENGFVHNEGLANEHAAKFYIGRGLRTIAYAYLRNARYCYLRWGALGKVRQIDENYRGSSEERIPSLRDAVITRAGEQLDFATVVKALQAISSEIVLGKLIETLVRIAVENAGAERGLLLLLRNDEPQVEAEATTISGRVEVVLKTLSVTSSDLRQENLDRERAEEALRASEQVSRGQVEALTFSLDVLATASEPQKYLARMLSIICGQLTGQSASLWLFDEPTDSLILRREVDSVNAVGFDREHPLIQNPQSWKESPVIQELFYAAGPIVCEDIETDPRLNDRFREYFMSKGTKKFLAVPILAGGQVRGMITVRHGERAPYRTEEIGLMQALAHQVMLAIRLTEVGEQSRQAAVLAERNRMARDVHDTLAQGFTGVIVQLEAAKYAISEGDRKEADSHLGRAGELARRSLSEARRSVHALRPQALEKHDFWQALKGLVKSTTVGTTLHTTFETRGKVPVLAPAWQENLLHIGQEALSNTLKYAHARNFRTRLISNSKELRLELRDDGEGFRIKERHDGIGLTGMRERAEEMGGELKIVSSLGKGTTVTAILPLNPELVL